MVGGTVVPQYLELRFPDGKLAGRYDPVRGILEIRRNGVNVYFDLAVLAMPILPFDKPSDTCYNFDR